MKVIHTTVTVPRVFTVTFRNLNSPSSMLIFNYIKMLCFVEMSPKLITIERLESPPAWTQGAYCPQRAQDADPPPVGWLDLTPPAAGPDPPYQLDLTSPHRLTDLTPPAAGPDPPGWTWPPCRLTDLIPPAAGRPPLLDLTTPQLADWPEPPHWLDLTSPPAAGPDPPPCRLDLTPPPAAGPDPPSRCEQTENITFPHPSDAGG